MKHLNRTSGHCENEQQCHFQLASPEHFFFVFNLTSSLFRVGAYASNIALSDSARQFDANTNAYATSDTNLGQ